MIFFAFFSQEVQEFPKKLWKWPYLETNFKIQLASQNMTRSVIFKLNDKTVKKIEFTPNIHQNVLEFLRILSKIRRSETAHSFIKD